MIFDEQISRKPNLYPWTQEIIETIHAGFWTDKEFSFSSDIQDFKVNLSDKEREIIVRTLSAIGQIEVAVKKFWARLGDNLPHPSLTDLGYVVAATEVIHNAAYERLLSVLGLEDIFEENLKLDIILGRVNYLQKYTHRFYKDSKKQYVYALILFSLFIENVSLFSQFYIVLWFGRYRNVLKDTTQQVSYTKNEECYKEGTEVLTPIGWVDFRDINIGDHIYQYVSGGDIELTKVLYKTEKDFSGNLIRFSRMGNECIVTPNHEMIYYNRKKEFVKRKACDMKLHKEIHIPVGGVLKNYGVEDLSFEDRLRIAIQADGSNLKWTNTKGETLLRGKNGGFTHNLNLTKDRKKSRFDWILSNLNLEFSKTPKDGDEIEYKVRYNHDHDYKSLEWIDFKDKTPQWCRQFIEECVQWDGYDTGTSVGYCSINKKNIDIVQTAAILAGYSTNIYEGNESSRKDTYHNCFKLSIMTGNLTPISHGVKKEEVSYSGKVYCVTVPSGNIITRYKDNTFIAGNCLHAQVGIKVINTIREEYPELFDDELEQRVIHEALEAFKAESKIIDWIMGDFQDKRISPDILKEYIKARLNDSLRQIGYREIFTVDEEYARDFEWMDEEVLGNNHTDFFYQKSVDYSKSNKSFDIGDLI